MPKKGKKSAAQRKEHEEDQALQASNDMLADTLAGRHSQSRAMILIWELS